jgi:hypothetical protein
MERKRVGGRFVRQNLDDDGGLRPGRRNAPGPTGCRTFTRAKVAESLPEIVDRFVEEAKKGSVAHAKLLTSLGGLDKSPLPATKKRRGKSMVALLMERLAETPKEESGGENS